MLRPAFVALGLAIGATAVFAQANPIAERREAMKAVGAATREGAAIAKGEVAFDAAKAQAVFKTYADAAKKVPGLYPDNSKTGGETGGDEDLGGPGRLQGRLRQVRGRCGQGRRRDRSRRLPRGLRRRDQELRRLPRGLSRQEVRQRRGVAETSRVMPDKPRSGAVPESIVEH